MNLGLKSSETKNLVILFVATFLLVSFFVYNKKSQAQSAPSLIPSSGSCALLMTLPIPYGFNVANNTNRNNVTGVYQTGFNFIGKINFNSSSAGTFSGQGINQTYNSINSPFIDTNNGVMYLNDWTVAIAPMTSANGFVGGYTFTFSGSQGGFKLVGVPSNGGNTIVFISAGIGTSNNPGVGPGTGVCQV